MTLLGLTVRPAELQEIGAFYARFGRYWAATVDGQMVAMAAISRVGDRDWACFNVLGGTGNCGAAVVRALRRGLVAHGGPVYVSQQLEARLLEVIGFERTEETLDRRPVWVWRPKNDHA